MSKYFHLYRDMAESAKAQHEVDKENFAAAKAEAQATWEKAKLTPKQRAEKMQAEREAEIAKARERQAEAQARIDAAKAARNK